LLRAHRRKCNLEGGKAARRVQDEGGGKNRSPGSSLGREAMEKNLLSHIRKGPGRGIGLFRLEKGPADGKRGEMTTA